MARSLHCLVSGKVQGVYFRAWVFDQASNLGLSGWVRNLDDSRVEVLAQGSESALEELRTRLLKGSPLSRVDNVDYSMIDYDKAHQGFSIR